MIKQYWIIVDFLELLECSCFDQTMHFRLQYFLYRLKLLLLKSENGDQEIIAEICSQEAMEEVRALFLEAITYEGAQRVQNQLEKKLSRMVSSLEGNNDADLPMAPASMTTPRICARGQR